MSVIATVLNVIAPSVFHFNAMVATPVGAVTDSAASPTNRVLWLPFDEPDGSVAANGASANHGVLYNGPAHNPDGFGLRSLCFDGVDDYVQVTPYPALQFGTNDFSVDAWIKPANNDSTIRAIVDHREENGPVVRGYSFYLWYSNRLSFQLADGSFSQYFSMLTVPADGQWHHVAVTVKRHDPQGLRFYLDGVQEARGLDPTDHSGSVTAGPGYSVRVGSRSSAVHSLFNGCIDEVEVFSRALAPAEITAIHQAGNAGKSKTNP